jgi:uncharacterized protein (TIGR02301 family)
LNAVLRAASASLVLALTLGVAGAAQNPPPKPAPPAEQPAPVEPPPPYEPQLLRLSELMGALAFLRDLCGNGDSESLRAKMTNLLETEARSPARKEMLAGAYNRGFNDYALAYRACTPAAREIITNFLEETGRIAKDLANRYGG